MAKRLALDSLVALSTTCLLAGLGERHAQAQVQDGGIVYQDFVEDGGANDGGSFAMADLLGKGVGIRLFEGDTEPSQGTVQITITDCQFVAPKGLGLPLDVILNENANPNTPSDFADFANVGGMATLTIASDLTPTAPFTISGPQRNTQIGVTGNVICKNPVTGAAIWVQAFLASDGDSGPPGSLSDVAVVRGLPPGPNGAANVPAVPAWGMTGLGVLLTGVGAVLVRRTRRKGADA